MHDIQLTLNKKSIKISRCVNYLISLLDFSFQSLSEIDKYHIYVYSRFSQNLKRVHTVIKIIYQYCSKMIANVALDT